VAMGRAARPMDPLLFQPRSKEELRSPSPLEVMRLAGQRNRLENRLKRCGPEAFCLSAYLLPASVFQRNLQIPTGSVFILLLTAGGGLLFGRQNRLWA